ncbi:MAG: class I SAM-dependent methyltransferase [bacterium]
MINNKNGSRMSENHENPIVKKYSQPQEIRAFTEYSKIGLEAYEKNAFSFLIKKNDVVLDLGCGAGREAKPVASMCSRVYAVDLVKGMLRTAKSIVNVNNVYFICADAMYLPVRSNTVDVVIMTKQFLNHITILERRRITMKEVYRVLKPGGRVFLTIHNNLFNIGIMHILNGVYKLFYSKGSTSNINANIQERKGNQTSLSSMFIGFFLLKFRSIFVNVYRRIASKIVKGYNGKEVGDWEISQVSNALSPYTSPYHNFTLKEITSLVLSSGFRIDDVKDTWELSHNRTLPGFLRKGAYTIAMFISK